MHVQSEVAVLHQTLVPSDPHAYQDSDQTRTVHTPRETDVVALILLQFIGAREKGMVGSDVIALTVCKCRPQRGVGYLNLVKEIRQKVHFDLSDTHRWVYYLHLKGCTVGCHETKGIAASDDLLSTLDCKETWL